jgi:aminoglycoside phosphotransferase (APT) family kinase protein
MTPVDWPPEVREALGTVQGVWMPPQGATSSVYIVQTEHNRFAVKSARGTQYGGWLAKEYRALSALASTGLPIPKPHAFIRIDQGVVPERYLMMDYLPGETLSAVLHQTGDAAMRAVLLRAFGHTLAMLHNAPIVPGLPNPNSGWLDYMLEEAAENLEHFSVDGTPELLARLRQARPEPISPTLIHGDYTIDNVMVEGERVTGIIDWSGAAVGDRRYDLALATRPQREAFRAERARDLQAFYEGYGAAPLSASDFDYFNSLYEYF